MSALIFETGAPVEIAIRLTGDSATTIVDGTDATGGAWLVHRLQANENNGSTPSLTMDLYDGTTAYYLGAAGVVYKAKALTAGQSVLFEDIVVPQGWKLRATSNDASGHIDLVGIKSQRIG